MKLVRRSVPIAARVLVCGVLYMVLRAQPWAAPAAVRIDTIAPLGPTEREVLVITGIGLGADARVFIGGAAAAVLDASDTQATFRVPRGITGGRLTVTAVNARGHSASIAYQSAGAQAVSSATAALIAEINASSLSRAAKRLLINTLTLSERALNDGRPRVARVLTDVFQLQVRTLQRSGQLPESTAASWVDQSNAFINGTPIANAGPDQTVQVTDRVQLSGAASTDPNGDALTYHWSLVSIPTGSHATLLADSGTDPATVVNPAFIADMPGTYVARLTVSDGNTTSAPDEVRIDTRNSPPIAKAGDDQTAPVGAVVALDGSASIDVDGDPLTYAWALVTKPALSGAQIVNATETHAHFTIDRPGLYEVKLVVTDPHNAASAPDFLTVSTENSAPVANAGPDQLVAAGDGVVLDSRASFDVDGDRLSFKWSFASRPEGSEAAFDTANETAEMPMFMTDVGGLYVVQLVVFDGKVFSTGDTITITANTPPQVFASADPTTVLLPPSGGAAGSPSNATAPVPSNSTSPMTTQLAGIAVDDGFPTPPRLTTEWTFSGPPGATLSNVTSSEPIATFTLPGAYNFTFTANDGHLSGSASVLVTVIEDACGTNNGGCDPLVQCTNTLNGPVCGACPAGYSGIDGTQCVACVPGTYSDTPGAATCTACPAGRYSPAGATECSVCAPGTYSEAGAETCSACPAGTFSSESGAMQCTQCAPGTYTDASGFTSCAACPAGSYADQSGAMQCTQCAPGTYAAADGSQTCNACPAGRYASESGAMQCNECAPGTYAAADRSPICSACPAGSFAAQSGAMQCTQCAPGTYAATDGSQTCNACPAGSFAAQSGETQCTQCAAGTYAAADGSQTCAACPAGFTSAAGATECTAIPPRLTLVKQVVNDDGGTAAATDFTLTATGATTLSGAGSATGIVSMGTYTLSETGPSGYVASGWTCVGGTQVGNQITLGPGDTATCTITNNDFFPQSCADIPDRPNGTYTLYFQGRLAQPYQAYCFDMDPAQIAHPTDPAPYKTYLTLFLTTPDDTACEASGFNSGLTPNVTMVSGGTGSDSCTRWWKVRFHPQQKRIDVNDQQFSHQTGGPYLAPFGSVGGIAGECKTGVAQYSNINLQGLPFAVNAKDPVEILNTCANPPVGFGEWGPTAWRSCSNGGTQQVVPSAGLQTVDLSAPGNCGALDPFVQVTPTDIVAGIEVAYLAAADCPAGFIGDPTTGCVDDDECAVNNGGCAVNPDGTPLASCTNTPGSRMCGACPSGYTGDGVTCSDVDECLVNNGGCAAGTTCTNTPGSWQCGCAAGFAAVTQNGALVCVDIDECKVDNGGCDPLTTCSNTPGSRTCGNCPAGYSGSGATGCSDINECLVDNGGCDPLTTCTNTTASRICGACPANHIGSGETGCIPFPSLTLQVEVVNDEGGSAASSLFTVSANGPTPLSGHGPSITSGASFAAGTYTLSHTGPAGYTAPDWVCTGLSQSAIVRYRPLTLALAPGASVTCTIRPNDKSRPESCAALAGQPNGDYTLYFQGQASQPYPAYCFDMDPSQIAHPSDPTPYKTYLTLPYRTPIERACDAANSSSGTQDHYETPNVTKASPDLCVRWEKVRFVPESGYLKVDDYEFTTFTGSGYFGAGQLLPFGAVATDAGPQTLREAIFGEKKFLGLIIDGEPFLAGPELLKAVEPARDDTKFWSSNVNLYGLPFSVPLPRFGAHILNTCDEPLTAGSWGPMAWRNCAAPGHAAVLPDGTNQLLRITLAGTAASAQPFVQVSDAQGDRVVPGLVLEYFTDVNECLEQNGGCSSDNVCVNTLGSRFCAMKCPAGYEPPRNADGSLSTTTCVDTNECQINNGGCSLITACTNTEGSRTCGPCPRGWTGTGDTACSEINECLLGNGGCDIRTVCLNVVGDRWCGSCPAGFSGSGTTSCVDINECLTNNGGCSISPRVTCTNTIGSRICGPCPSGFTGNGVTCTDINECLVNNGGCAQFSACINTQGSRICGPCQPGFTGTGTTSCTDINECATDNGGCGTDTCVNPLGAPHYCASCGPGFTGTQETGCIDINECATGNGGCAVGSTCTNTPGSRVCSCPAGFVYTGTACVDVNECFTNNGGCDALTTCTNTSGSRTCGACPAGYTGTGATGCIDNNECLVANGGCDPAATCTNTPGSRSCVCPSGLLGDGITCFACPAGYTSTDGVTCTLMVAGQLQARSQPRRLKYATTQSNPDETPPVDGDDDSEPPPVEDRNGIAVLPEPTWVRLRFRPIGVPVSTT